MTETERAIASMVAHPPKAERSWKVLALSTGAVFLTAIAVAGLVIGLINVAGQRAAAACQTTINAQFRENSAAQASISDGSRKALRDMLSRQAADLGVVLDPNQPAGARQLALIDYKIATDTYVAASVKADEERAKNPIEPLTGQCT